MGGLNETMGGTGGVFIRVRSAAKVLNHDMPIQASSMLNKSSE